MAPCRGAQFQLSPTSFQVPSGFFGYQTKTTKNYHKVFLDKKENNIFLAYKEIQRDRLQSNKAND
jgi:hypothetical protein